MDKFIKEDQSAASQNGELVASIGKDKTAAIFGTDMFGMLLFAINFTDLL